MNNKASRKPRARKETRERFGPIQKKVLLLLLGGLALSCARSTQKQWHIIKGLRKSWDDINKQAAERAIAALYESNLLEAKENADGTTTLVLSEDGKKRALTYRIRYAKIKAVGPWDKKWRIVLYDIPEDERESRDALRDHLTEIGIRKLQHSAGIHPFDCKNEVDFFIELLGIRKYVRFIIADSIDDEMYWKRKFNLDKYI